MNDAIPGSAKDDFDRLRMLWLRSKGRDLSSPFELSCMRRGGGGHGWTVEVIGEQEASNGAGIAEIVSAWVAELTRFLLLRRRRDDDALRLCGVELAPFDPPDPEIVDAPSDDSSRPIQALPKAARA